MGEGSDIMLLAIGTPAAALLAGSVVVFSSKKTLSSLLQLLGAACLMVVVLAHVAEALLLFPWMAWGRPDSTGHYLDLGSAVLGLTLFPAGYLCAALKQRYA